MNRRNGTHVGWLVGIVVATVVLIGLTWTGTLSATHTQRAEAEARISANVANETAMFAQRLQRQFLEIDQTLRILAAAWEANSRQFDLVSWQNRLVLLNEISPDVLIADEGGTVRHGTTPDAVGQSVGQRDYFRHAAQRPADDDQMYIGESMTGPIIRQWHMNLARRLRHNDGSFAGVIVAGLRLSAVSSFYQTATIGAHGMICVVGLPRGEVRVAIGPRPMEPGMIIADSEMFLAMQAHPDAVWVGRSPVDGVERIHGFRRVADRNLAVIVAVDRAEALRATERWETAAYVFASGITVLLVSLAVILMHALRAARRREVALARDRAELAATNRQLELAKSLADDKTAQLEATLDGMYDGVAMVDADTRLVEWNQRFADIAGIPSSILHVGLPMEEILRVQAASGQFGIVDIETEVARRMAILRSGSFASITERERPDGTVVELRRNRLPTGGFVTLYTDITERKKAENALHEANALAEAATRAMSRFVAIVSHEIRTPLNALLNSLTLLADSGMAATQRGLLDVARRSGDALMALINDILEMSRMEAGQLTLRPSIFALRPLIENMLEMFATQAAERRIALRMSIAQGVPDELYEDPGRLRQVLINLVSNAVKFAAFGEVRVAVETRVTAGSTALRLTVRDRGPIIPEASRVRLFEPFSRLEEEGIEGPLGSGLGLTICRHLVSLMGGEIGCSVWSVGSRDAGNEFWITLPIKPLPSHAGAQLQTYAQPRRWLPRTRILLVEDILANQLVTATLLRREGHMVDIASSGHAAISAVSTRPYDLVFMDIFMPGISGLETTRRIRGMAGPAAGIPIIALTANLCAEDQAQCAAAGMNGVLGKPVALRDLLNAIAAHVWPHQSDRGLDRLPSVSAVSSASPVLSSARLDDLRATLSVETLSSLVEDCLTDLSQRLLALQAALDQGEAEQVHAHAHAMAGMAAEYGMAALEMRMRALMQLAKLDRGSAIAAAEQVEAEVSRAGAALRAALQHEIV
jgi:signal transduction histidine kinase/DNA-binding response OmpR family regulator